MKIRYRPDYANRAEVSGVGFNTSEHGGSVGLEFSDLYVGIYLRGENPEKQMIVCERDGKLLYKTTRDYGTTWTEFREI